MLFRKNKLDKLSKNISAHDRAHDLNALMSGAFFDLLMSARSRERAHEIKVRELAHMSAITLTLAHDQHLYFYLLVPVLIQKRTHFDEVEYHF
jgi:hypothetical protein